MVNNNNIKLNQKPFSIEISTLVKDGVMPGSLAADRSSNPLPDLTDEMTATNRTTNSVETSQSSPADDEVYICLILW